MKKNDTECIAIIAQTFHPDLSGIGNYSTDFAKFLDEEGYDVEIFTGFSFYPEWEKNEDDKGVLYRKESFYSSIIHRCYNYVPHKVTLFSRLLNELSQFISICLLILAKKKFDKIFVFTTPVSFGVIGSLHKVLYKSELIINVQDLQTNAAKSLDMTSFSYLIRILERVEGWTYQKADKVYTISKGMKKAISDKGDGDVGLWYNWISKDEIPNKLDKNVRDKLNLPNRKKLILYAGNIGVKQGVEEILELAEGFESNGNVHFALAGGGAEYKRIKDLAKKKKYKNLSLLPFLNKSTYYSLLSATDLFFIPQNKTDTDIYFPSKLLGIAYMQVPILVSADPKSELYKVVKENNLGYAYQKNNLEEGIGLINHFLETEYGELNYQDSCQKFVSKFFRSNVLNRVKKEIFI